MSKRSSVGKFIEKERQKGKSDRQIRHSLLDAGWHMDIIQSAMSSDKKSLPTISSKVKAKKKPNFLSRLVN